MGNAAVWRISLDYQQVTMNISQINQKVPPVAALSLRKPSVALVMPYDPKMTPKQEIDARFRRLLAVAEKSLLSAHPAETALPVLRKLQQLARGLNSETHRMGVAIFVSDELARVSYLDFEVEERLLVDEPFLLRDIADCKPDNRDYLVLLLSAKESRMYLNTAKGLKLVKSNTPQNIYAYLNEVPERTGNFSDPEQRRETMLNKFLHHMDLGLGAVLKMYPLPVFVIGPDRVAGHFGRITRNAQSIAGYIHNQSIDATVKELAGVLEPLLADWRKTKQQLLLRQMEQAAQAGKLVCGIPEARKAAGCRNTRLIVVERTACRNEDGSFYTDGEIDTLIEKVLENGGQVEKMDKDLLQPYGSVALIKYY